MSGSESTQESVSGRLSRRGGMHSARGKAFAVVSTALMLLVGFQALMYYRPSESPGPEAPSRVVNNLPAPGSAKCTCMSQIPAWL